MHRGGKKSKERLTVLVCCNADGSRKLQLLVVGKLKNPPVYQRHETLAVLVHSQLKCMDDNQVVSRVAAPISTENGMPKLKCASAN